MITRSAAVLVLLALSAGASAQDAAPAATTQTKPLADTSFSLSFGGTWIGEADLDDSPGSLGIARAGARLGVGHKLSDTVTLNFGADVDYSVYDFDDASGLIAGTDDPFDDSTIVTLSLGAKFKSGERNTWFVTGLARSAGESGAEFDETLTGGGIVGFSHSFSDDLTVGIGVLASSELEDEVYVIPVPIIRWNINEQWTLASGERANVQLTYAPSDRWAFGAEASWDRRRFRLDDEGPLPSGVVEERHVPVGVFARFSPGPNIELSARVGAHLGSEIKIDDENGDRVGKDDLESALYAGFDVRFRF
ncbi:MAG: hypothetical protein DYG94_09755 [Leptolyngbya sp. PLA3]|nr:MAG: hypothetical protein EDM82_07940 [Cyanobacteria bacterium CYA]MCE7969014.1 hypothetical protein [Leptolyngbya sp. PL-A3]